MIVPTKLENAAVPTRGDPKLYVLVGYPALIRSIAVRLARAAPRLCPVVLTAAVG
jgi:hypothetical protein